MLLRGRAGNAYFEVVEVPPESPILRRSVEFDYDDIRPCQPSFAGVRSDHLAWMVLRDAVPVGAVLATGVDGHAEVAHLDLDYDAQPHRDFTAGKVLFGSSGPYRTGGIRRVESAAETANHRRYLARMGFDPGTRAWSRDVNRAGASAMDSN